MNGHITGAAGNEDEEYFPHDVFPAEGDDRWVAIVVRDDAEWRALCEVIERPDLETLGRGCFAEKSQARLATMR